MGEMRVMNDLLERIAYCVEVGKVDKKTPYPPDLRGQEGAYELTAQAIKEGYKPDDLLQKAFIKAMNKVGRKFSERKIFVPQMLMSAKAMTASMQHLKPFFQTGEVKRKGILVIGTVEGDLHDIGKNLVAMIVEGAGWEVVDLGSNVKIARFLEAIEAHPGCFVGLSALLTTTMINMGKTVKEIRERMPQTVTLIGGAPVTEAFKSKIGADFYSPTPQGAVDFLNGFAES